MKLKYVSVFLTLALVCACSSIPRETDQQALARLTSYAGAPVDDIRTYSHFDGWSPVDERHILINSGVNAAYLLTVSPPCSELPFATHVAFTSRFPHTISRLDFVKVGRNRCLITEIRPVNTKQMRADSEQQKAQKES